MSIVVLVPNVSYIKQNLLQGMKRSCKNIYPVYYSDYMSSSWSYKDIVNKIEINYYLPKIIEKKMEEERVNLLFVIAYDDFVYQDTIKKIRKKGVRTVNFIVDSPTQWFRIIKTASSYDLIASAHKKNINLIKKYNGNTIYFPMAADPEDFVSEGKINKIEVSFVGSYTETRSIVFNELMKNGINVDIWGNWKKLERKDGLINIRTFHDILFYGLPRIIGEREEFFSRINKKVKKNKQNIELNKEKKIKDIYNGNLADIFKNSIINLGFSQSVGDPLNKNNPRWIRGRDFEVLASGGFLLVQEAPERNELFEKGKHLEIWNDIKELKQKIKYYLENPLLAEDIAKKGNKYLMEKHTWKKRMEELLKILCLERELKK